MSDKHMAKIPMFLIELTVISRTILLTVDVVGSENYTDPCIET